MTSKKTLALLLLIGFGTALTYAVNNYPQQGRISTSKPFSPQEPYHSKYDNRMSGPRIAPLRKNRPTYNGCQADLFRPLFDRPPTLKPKPRSKIRKQPSSPPVIAQPAPLQEPTIARELANFTYLGQVNEGTCQSVFLKGKGRIFIVKAGDVFGENQEFRLARITEKEISIAMREYAEPFRIPLQEEQPLMMSMALETIDTDTRHLRPRPRQPSNRR